MVGAADGAAEGAGVGSTDGRGVGKAGGSGEVVGELTVETGDVGAVLNKGLALLPKLHVEGGLRVAVGAYNRGRAALEQAHDAAEAGQTTLHARGNRPMPGHRCPQ